MTWIRNCSKKCLSSLPNLYCRRNVSGGQPFIEIRNEPQTNVLSSHSTPLDNEEAESALETSPKLSNVLGLSSLNEGVQAIESTLGRYLFPFR